MVNTIRFKYWYHIYVYITFRHFMECKMAHEVSDYAGYKYRHHYNI